VEVKMGLSAIMEFLGDFGALALAAGMFFYWMFHNIKSKVKREQDDCELDKTERYNQIMHDEEIAQLLKQALQQQLNIHDDDQENTYMNIKIDEMLNQLLLETAADRALLFIYHNGGKDINGRSFQRMSCVNEAVKPGLIPLQTQYQNFFRTFLMCVYNSLIKCNYFYMDDVEEIKTKDPATYYYFQSRGSKCVYIIGIKNDQCETMGFLSISAAQPIHDLAQAKKELQEVVYKIEGMYAISQQSKRLREKN
jgi:hypothetical protein